MKTGLPTLTGMTKSLWPFFHYFLLTKQLYVGDTKAAELTSVMIGKSDKTMNEWGKQLLQNREIPESKQVPKNVFKA